MPFGWKWPFGRRKSTSPDQAAEATPSSEPATVQRSIDVADVAETDLGADLIARESSFRVPPTLGESGGLGIAQNVRGATDFIQRLPVATSSAMLSLASMPDMNEFVASLPALTSFTNLESTPVLMGELPTPGGLTDELPPLGGLPHQLPGLIGVALETPEVAGASMPSARPAPSETTIGPVAPIALTSPAIDRAAPQLSEPIQRVVAPMEPLAAPSGPIEAARPIESPLPLNNFAESLPLISVPPEVRNAEAPFMPAAAPIDLGQPIEQMPGELMASLPDRSPDLLTPSPITQSPLDQSPLDQSPIDQLPVNQLPSDRSTSSSEPSLTISRYAEELLLPPTVDRETLLEHEAPPSLITPPVAAPAIGEPTTTPTLNAFAEPMPLVGRPEEVVPSLPELEEAPSIGEAPHELFAASPVDQVPIDRLPVEQMPAAPLPGNQSTPSGEPTLAISRYAEEVPLIDLNVGVSEAASMRGESVTTEPSIELSQTSIAAPELVLPSISEATTEGTQPASEAPISISRMAEEALSGREPFSIGVTPIQRMPLLGGLSSLTQNLPSLGGLTQNVPSWGGLSQNLPSLGGLTQGLPSMSGLTDNLPSLGGLSESLPSLGGLAQNLPTLGGLTENLPSLSGLAGSLPSLGELTKQLPSLGGLTSPEMPLPPSINEAIGGLGGAAQEAMGQITSMAPSIPEMPSMPQLPSMEKLADLIWREIQKKLKVERERTRGLA